MTKDYTCSLLFLIDRDQDRILLAMKKRGFGSDRYNGIGGKQDPGETIEQTTIRECQEEIGVTPRVLQKVAVHDFIINAGDEDSFHMYVHTFMSETWDGEPIETEEMRPVWFAFNAIPYDQMWDDDILWLPAVLAGRTMTTVFEFDRNEKVTSAAITLTDL